MTPDQEALIELANAKMPFGKYAGRYLVDLPEAYVLWFKGKGYPQGQAGGSVTGHGRNQDQRPGSADQAPDSVAGWRAVNQAAKARPRAWSPCWLSATL